MLLHTNAPSFFPRKATCVKSGSFFDTSQGKRLIAKPGIPRRQWFQSPTFSYIGILGNVIPVRSFGKDRKFAAHFLPEPTMAEIFASLRRKIKAKPRGREMSAATHRHGSRYEDYWLSRFHYRATASFLCRPVETRRRQNLPLTRAHRNAAAPIAPKQCRRQTPQ